MEKYRNNRPETKKVGGSTAEKNQKYIFSELAVRHSHIFNGNPVEKAKISNNGSNRKKIYGKAGLYLKQVLDAVKNRQSFDLGPGFQILAQMAEFDQPQDELFIMSIHFDDRFKFLIHHSVNVAIYSLKMASDLGFKKKQKMEVSMAALLHDIGMAVIPERIIYKDEKLNQQEKKILRERPNYSRKILQCLGDEFAYLAEIASQVYERIDGTGFPRGLVEDEIHEYAQIIGLLDMYEALIHSRPYREKLTNFKAVKHILNTGKNRFQRTHLKSLLRVFTPFPIHSYVRLNSNAIGKVVETYAEQPMRPKVQIILDSQNRQVLTERIVSLSDNPLLNIVDSVSNDEIQEISQAQSL